MPLALSCCRHADTARAPLGRHEQLLGGGMTHAQSIQNGAVGSKIHATKD